MDRHDGSTPRQRIEIGRTRIAIIRDDAREVDRVRGSTP
jgi:hypothetical protein